MEPDTLNVIGIGDNVVDHYIHNQTRFPGGNALNFSVYAARLGISSAYLGIFGTDENGRHVRHALELEGVDISHCRTAEGPNGEAILKIEGGERIFVESNEGGIRKSTPMGFIFEDLGYLKSFAVAHTSAYSYMDPYLPQLQNLGPLISYDFSDDFDRDYALALCPHIDVGFFSCSQWKEKAVNLLLEAAVERGCTMAVATRGPREVIAFNGHSWFRQAPLAIQATDTLGAGDAFITRFLIDYVADRSREGAHQASAIRHALREAVSFAAEICQVPGSFGHGKQY